MTKQWIHLLRKAIGCSTFNSEENVFSFLRTFFIVSLLALGVFTTHNALAGSCEQEYALECPAGQMDACLIPDSKADHHFCTFKNFQQYQFAGSINVPENSNGYLYLANGTPAIKEFVLAMDRKCRFSHGAVVKADPKKLIEATKLIRTREHGYTREFYYSVNGGYGAVLQAIDIEMAGKNNLFLTTFCPVSVYVAYTDNN
ncbi:MAG: hypothetical protein ACKOA8_08515 [Deltaproteobacteria bacterium]